jgi:hypothetical protein
MKSDFDFKMSIRNAVERIDRGLSSGIFYFTYESDNKTEEKI